MGANQWQGVMVIFDASHSLLTGPWAWLHFAVPELDVHQLTNRALCLLVSLCSVSCIIMFMSSDAACLLPPPSSVLLPPPTPPPTLVFIFSNDAFINHAGGRSDVFHIFSFYIFFPFFFSFQIYHSPIHKQAESKSLTITPVTENICIQSFAFYLPVVFFPPRQWNWTRPDSSLCESASTTSKQKVKFIPAVFLVLSDSLRGAYLSRRLHVDALPAGFCQGINALIATSNLREVICTGLYRLLIITSLSHAVWSVLVSFKETFFTHSLVLSLFL